MTARLASKALKLASPHDPEAHPLYVAKLASSGLAPNIGALLGCRALAAPPHPSHPPGKGFTLPYYDLKGKLTGFYRWRYLEDPRRGFAKLSGKALRYVQPPETLPELYIPPLMNWGTYLADSGNRLVFTEGELKAAAATAAGIPTLALGGVWAFRSAKSHVSILSIFEHLNLKDREVIICFDSDAAINPDVRRAEVYFAKELGTLGAVVSVARLPPHSDGTKLGLDDYLVAYGAQALLEEVFAVCEPYEETAKLHALNLEVVVVKKPGFVVRLEDGQAMTTGEFTALHYANWHHIDYSDPAKPRRVATAQEWLKWPQRAETASITYAPGQPQITPQGALNTWPGWGCEPTPLPDRRGSSEAQGRRSLAQSPERRNPDSLGLHAPPVPLWDTLLDTLFGAGTWERAWVEQWIAYPLQHPGAKMYSAVLLWSRAHGTGKSLLGYSLKRIYGANFKEVNDDDLEGRSEFNAWAKETQFVLGDDITGHTSRRFANRLKTYITRESITINEKGVKQYPVPDCINFLYTANSPDAVYLEDGDRRYFIHQVTSAPRPTPWYTQEYDPWYKSAKGASDLFAHLLSVDLTGFDPKAPAPATQAKMLMTQINKTELEEWIDCAKADPEGYLRGLSGDLFTPEELCALFDPGGVKRDTSPTLMARKLAQAGVLRCVPTLPPGAPPSSYASTGQVRSKVKGKLVRLYAIRNPHLYARASAEALADHYDAHRAAYRSPTSKVSAPAQPSKLRSRK